MEQEYKYMVCTRCFTFNQENYVVDALNGFVKQETSFPVVYVIVDDDSTDNTADVIRKYVRDYFDLEDKSVAYEKNLDYGHVIYARHKTNRNCFFAVLFLNENHHSKKKTKSLYLKEWTENSKYRAICEGDDFWTAPDKLQVQVAFLESHPDFSMCFHSVNNISPDGSSRVYSRYPEDVEECPIEDFFHVGGAYAPTCSMVLDWKLLRPMPSFWKKSDVGDSPLILTLFLRGKVHFMKDVMAAYRVNSAGSWSQKQKQLSLSQIMEKSRTARAYWDEVDRYTERKYARLIRQRKLHTWLSFGKSMYYYVLNKF